MNKIKNVLLCGLGGVGCVCACPIYDSGIANIKILVDEERYRKYKNQPTIFNDKEYFFDYILPDNLDFKADLVIISTKNNGLENAINNIKNFVVEETIIISLLNGIQSEKKLGKKYNKKNIPISFFIGSSCIREDRKITQSGNYEFIIGDKNNPKSKNIELLSSFFEECNIKHKVSNHILDRYWKKFMVNVGLNQLCAANNITFKELKKKPELIEQLKALIWEVKLIAEKEGINNPQKLYDDTIKFLIEDFEDANPSMLQDIRNKRKTEVEIFAGEVIKLGKKYKIETSENKKLYKIIKEIENNY